MGERAFLLAPVAIRFTNDYCQNGLRGLYGALEILLRYGLTISGSGLQLLVGFRLSAFGGNRRCSGTREHRSILGFGRKWGSNTQSRANSTTFLQTRGGTLARGSYRETGTSVSTSDPESVNTMPDAMLGSGGGGILATSTYSETASTGGSTARSSGGIGAEAGRFASSVALGGSSVTEGTSTGGGTAETSGTIPHEKPIVKSIALGGGHACALHSDGSVKCWGWNSHGELGDGGVLPSPKPVVVAGLSNVKQISAGLQFSCALLDEGTVKCWGNNSCGELGTGDSEDSHIPTEVSNLDQVVSISAGYGVTCAVVQGGGLYCWGCNDFGALGQGTFGGSSKTPVKVSGGATYISVSAGYQVCGISSINDLLCWGSNSTGEVGDGSTDDRNSPLKVGIAASVATGFGHACAVGLSQKVACWGANDYGQLGDGSNSPSTAPVQVNDLTGVTVIDASSENTCALVGTEVKCWGRGPLGDGTTADSPIPVPVKNIGQVRSIGVGSGFACAVLIDNSVYCWGVNNYGQLGDGTTQDRLYPVKAVDL